MIVIGLIFGEQLIDPSAEREIFKRNFVRTRFISRGREKRGILSEIRRRNLVNLHALGNKCPR